jgi:hypothetical protein
MQDPQICTIDSRAVATPESLDSEAAVPKPLPLSRREPEGPGSLHAFASDSEQTLRWSGNDGASGTGRESVRFIKEDEMRRMTCER